MTDLLQRAFSEAAKLPVQEQDAFAEWMLEELASELRWERSFASSSDALARLAREALREHREGRTKKLIVDEL